MSLATQFKETLLELRSQNTDPMALCRAIKKNRKIKDQVIIEAVLFCSLLEAYLQPYTLEVSVATATDSQVHIILTWSATLDTHVGYSISLGRDPYIHQIYPDNAASPFLWVPGALPIDKLFDFILLGQTGNYQIVNDSIQKLVSEVEDPETPLSRISNALYKVLPEVLFSTWYVSSNGIVHSMGSLFRSSLELAMQMHQLAKTQVELSDLYPPCSYTQGVSILRMTFVEQEGPQEFGEVYSEYFPSIAFAIGLLSKVASPFSLILDKDGVSSLVAVRPFKKNVCWSTRDEQAYRVEFALVLVKEIKKSLQVPGTLESGEWDYWISYTKSVLLSGLTDPTSPLGAMLSYATALFNSKTAAAHQDSKYVFTF